MNFVVGLVGMVIGAMIVIYTQKLIDFFGRIDFFDRYIGMFGGTRMGYKLIGLLVFFLSLLYFTNMFDTFMLWVLGPILPQQR